MSKKINSSGTLHEGKKLNQNKERSGEAEIHLQSLLCVDKLLGDRRKGLSLGSTFLLSLSGYILRAAGAMSSGCIESSEGVNVWFGLI